MGAVFCACGRQKAERKFSNIKIRAEVNKKKKENYLENVVGFNFINAKRFF